MLQEVEVQERMAQMALCKLRDHEVLFHEMDYDSVNKFWFTMA